MTARGRFARYLRWERSRSRRGLIALWRRLAKEFGLRSYLDVPALANPTRKRVPARDVLAAIERRTRKRWPEGAITIAEWRGKARTKPKEAIAA